MADPSYPIVMIGGVPVVDAPQEIDAVNAEWFRTVLLHAASCGPATVVVNMAGTRFCNSSGVGVLAWAHGLAAAEGGQLLLVIPADATVLRVLAFAGIDRLILHFAELPEAIQQAHAVVPRPCTGVPCRPQARAYPMSNSSGSCDGRCQRDWHPSTRQDTT